MTFIGQLLATLREFVLDFGLVSTAHQATLISVVMIIMLAATILMLVFGLIFMFFSSDKSRSNTVLMLGPCDSGKTVAFMQLKTQSFIETHTSMDVLEDSFPIQNGDSPVHIVAYPGHPRLQTGVDPYIEGATCIVFFLDAVKFVDGLKDATDMLYHLLMHPQARKSKIPVMIACNKSDSARSLRIPYIRNRLEKELEQVRKTQISLRSQDEDTTTEQEILGRENIAFTFEQDAPTHISWCECSGKENTLEQMISFIRQHTQ